MSKRSCFRTPFGNEGVNGLQTLLKSARHHDYPLVSSVRGKLSCKKLPSISYEILRLFVNALTADDKYSESNMQIFGNNFKRHYLRSKTFSGFLIAFLKCAWNLEHFQKKDEFSSLIISDIIDAERRGNLNL